METLQIEKSKVLSVAKNYPYGKEFLEELFPEAFRKRSWDEIISYEIACEEQPVHPDDIIHETDSDDVVAYKMLKHIIKCVNPSDFIADFTNTTQKKWTPIFNGASGFRFQFSYCYYVSASTDCGSRLCLMDEARSDFMGKTHIKLYERFIIKK